MDFNSGQSKYDLALLFVEKNNLIVDKEVKQRSMVLRLKESLKFIPIIFDALFLE